MDRLNYTFFEEFKHLDKICGDMYQSQAGVTAYIEDMKSMSAGNNRRIPGWEEDLKQLLKLCHIRNHLAHEVGAFDTNVCTQEDIDWVQRFCERILNQCDPIAVLHQDIQYKKIQYKNQEADQSYISNDGENFTYNKKAGEIGVIVMMLAIILTIIILFFLV